MDAHHRRIDPPPRIDPYAAQHVAVAAQCILFLPPLTTHCGVHPGLSALHLCSIQHVATLVKFAIPPSRFNDAIRTGALANESATHPLALQHATGITKMTVNGSASAPTSGPLAPPPQYEIEVANDSQERLINDIKSENIEPLWLKMGRLNPPTPEPKAIAHKFEYAKLRPHLIRAGKLVTEKQAERRVLMLINPAMGASSSARKR